MFGDAWNRVKNEGAKAKLQAELKLLDREVNKRQKLFGVDLYDLLSQQAKLAPAFMSKLQAQVKEPYDQAKHDITKLQMDRLHLQEQIDLVQCNADRARPAYTTKGHLIKAGQTIKDTGIEAKLQAQVVLLDRNIKMRKETFGVDVFTLLQANPEAAKNNLIGNMAAKLSSREQEIQKCIEKAKHDVTFIIKKKEYKEREIKERSSGTW
ncbi:hypothetical protein MPSEU_000152100 [Mayamaea pseudoterrestris]|nr:hypothetical protein MPSEU_000152100 [Mayamaea pseudoterrestris]